MMAEKRKRGQNFSLEEKDKLVKILLTYKDTILNKKTDGTTNEAKSNAWISVTNTFNSTGTVYRNKESLMKIWEKLKSESKIYYYNTKQNCIKTGGGPSIIKIDPILEQVCAILGRGCTGILGVSDCDAEEENSVKALPKIICFEDAPSKVQYVQEYPIDLPTEAIIDMPSEEVNHISEFNPNKENEPTKIICDFEINKTPLWSRRRPQLSQKNERTEAVSSLCASFTEVNKKKENIEDLKVQLLQKEIDFKNQLYQLQLEKAKMELETTKKELEIKSEVLAQLRGGGLSLQSLFGVPQKK